MDKDKKEYLFAEENEIKQLTLLTYFPKRNNTSRCTSFGLLRTT